MVDISWQEELRRLTEDETVDLVDRMVVNSAVWGVSAVEVCGGRFQLLDICEAWLDEEPVRPERPWWSAPDVTLEAWRR